MVVKPKDQQVKMTAGHQPRATQRDSDTGAGVGGARSPALAAPRLDGRSFLLAVAFRMTARFLPRSSHGAKGQFTKTATWRALTWS